MSLLRSLPCMGWCVVKIKLLMVAWVKKKLRFSMGIIVIELILLTPYK